MTIHRNFKSLVYYQKISQMKLIDKLQEILNSHKVTGIKLSTEETQPVTLAVTAKTAEGVEVGTPADAWAERVEVYIVTEEGQTPATDGDIVLEDGTTLTIEGGKIKAITAKPEEMSSEVLDVVNKLAERVGALEATNGTQAAELSALKTSNEELTAKLSAAETKATEAEKKVTELSKQAATTSVKEKTELTKHVAPVATATKSFEKMTYTERVLAQCKN